MLKKIWQLQLQVSNICRINNMFRTRFLSLMYCVNLAEFTHISLLLMRVLKIKLYEIGVSRCIIYDFLVVFSFFEKTTYCCRARRLSVRPSVCLSVCPSVRLWK